MMSILRFALYALSALFALAALGAIIKSDILAAVIMAIICYTFWRLAQKIGKTRQKNDKHSEEHAVLSNTEFSAQKCTVLQRINQKMRPLLNAAQWIGIIFFGLILIVGIIDLTRSPEQKAAEATAREQASAKRSEEKREQAEQEAFAQVLSQAKRAKPEDACNAVTTGFFDPDSAKCRKVRRPSVPAYEDLCFCGEVNGKNRMGGYVGYTDFLVCLNETGTDWMVLFIGEKGSNQHVCRR